MTAYFVPDPGVAHLAWIQSELVSALGPWGKWGFPPSPYYCLLLESPAPLLGTQLNCFFSWTGLFIFLPSAFTSVAIRLNSMIWRNLNFLRGQEAKLLGQLCDKYDASLVTLSNLGRWKKNAISHHSCVGVKYGTWQVQILQDFVNVNHFLVGKQFTYLSCQLLM